MGWWPVTWALLGVLGAVGNCNGIFCCCVDALLFSLDQVREGSSGAPASFPSWLIAALMLVVLMGWPVCLWQVMHALTCVAWVLQRDFCECGC